MNNPILCEVFGYLDELAFRHVLKQSTTGLSEKFMRKSGDLSELAKAINNRPIAQSEGTDLRTQFQSVQLI